MPYGNVKLLRIPFSTNEQFFLSHKDVRVLPCLASHQRPLHHQYIAILHSFCGAAYCWELAAWQRLMKLFFINFWAGTTFMIAQPLLSDFYQTASCTRRN